MTYSNPRYVNAEGWVMVDRDDGATESMAPGTLAHDAVTGYAAPYGPVAAYVPPAPPSEAQRLAAWRATAQAYDFHFKEAMSLKGDPSLEDQFEALDPLTSEQKRAWLRTTIYQRGGPSVPIIQAALSLTDEQIDDLFATAMDLEGGGPGWPDTKPPAEWLP